MIHMGGGGRMARLGTWGFAKLDDCEKSIPGTARKPDSESLRAKEATSSLIALSTALLETAAHSSQTGVGRAALEAWDPLVLGTPA